MAKIDILLAAYNNAAYLPAQIRSLQNQTFTDWRLLVHDDGSADDTVGVVREFASADSRITLIEDGVTFHSAQGNFMHLLPFSDSEFAIFCDGDDIWLDN
ncbi:MAG: glycosyltransferase, partial [Alloprevotella sp.]|nr:glycosyltransferase [Alloprevotella sp.]